MRKSMGLLMMVSGALMAGPQLASQELAPELKPFQGTWVAEKVIYNGTDHGEKLKLRLVLKENQFTVEAEEKVKKEYGKFMIKLDPSTSPKCLDITISDGVQKGASMEGIYELKDDVFRICARVFGNERPTAFEAPDGSSCVLVELRREKN